MSTSCSLSEDAVLVKGRWLRPNNVFGLNVGFGEDAVESAWRVVDPILGEAVPLRDYEPGTWGPPEALELIDEKGEWHNPQPKEQRLKS